MAYVKKIIVISAVNIVEGGALSILNECLSSLSKGNLINEYRIIAIVHDRNLVKYDGIEYIDIANSKKSWMHRLFYEYIYFKKISNKLRPYLWLSLHDVTPNVSARVLAVYCHNPTAFYSPTLKMLKYAQRELLFTLLYKYLYRININKNKFIIVQQRWLKNAFHETYALSPSQIIVATPEKSTVNIKNDILPRESNIVRFFYPAYPRTFKNFEVICDACIILNNNGIRDYEVVLTLDGSENSYAKYIIKRYNSVEHIKFTGLLPKDQVLSLYGNTSCLIFPSKLETWGLPISEFKLYNRPMIIADLPYAHETAAGASCVAYFNPQSSRELADIMADVISDNHRRFHASPLIDIGEPKADSWCDLFNILLK